MSALFDTHAHLHDPALLADIDDVLARARSAGVERCVTVGTDLQTSRAAVALAETHDEIFATVGLHPHDAKDWTPELARELRALAASERVVAIGEIGLDFYRKSVAAHDPATGVSRAARPGRRAGFAGRDPLARRARCDLGRARPVGRRVPARGACGRVALLLRPRHPRPRLRRDGLPDLVRRPDHLPQERRATRRRRRAARLDAIVLETDCSLPHPQPHARQTKRNPPTIRHTAEQIAEPAAVTRCRRQSEPTFANAVQPLFAFERFRPMIGQLCGFQLGAESSQDVSRILRRWHHSSASWTLSGGSDRLGPSPKPHPLGPAERSRQDWRE